MCVRVCINNCIFLNKSFRNNFFRNRYTSKSKIRTRIDGIRNIRLIERYRKLSEVDDVYRCQPSLTESLT